MKAAVAAIALSAAALAPPFGAAQAHATVAVGIDTPGFGIRIGPSYFAAAPVFPAPVYVPAPVYAPPVVYVPPRVVIRPPVVFPVVYPYGVPVVKHHRRAYRDARGAIVSGGYVYGRY